MGIGALASEKPPYYSFVAFTGFRVLVQSRFVLVRKLSCVILRGIFPKNN